MSDIENYIGNTPLVLIDEVGTNKIYGKLEGNNPAGSIKDRPAIRMIKDAESSGYIKKGDTLIEATSGNTGIGLALVCASKNYPLVVTMPDSASIERRKLMRFLGAKVLLTPAEEIELAHHVQQMKDLLNLPLEERTPRQKHKIKMGKRARDRMMAANLRLVVSVAKKYQNQGLELLDLVQEGAIGLERAVDNFDPAMGYKFSTYAYWWIRPVSYTHLTLPTKRIV